MATGRLLHLRLRLAGHKKTDRRKLWSLRSRKGLLEVRLGALRQAVEREAMLGSHL